MYNLDNYICYDLKLIRTESQIEDFCKKMNYTRDYFDYMIKSGWERIYLCKKLYNLCFYLKNKELILNIFFHLK